MRALETLAVTRWETVKRPTPFIMRRINHYWNLFHGELAPPCTEDSPPQLPGSQLVRKLRRRASCCRPSHPQMGGLCRTRACFSIEVPRVCTWTQRLRCLPGQCLIQGRAGTPRQRLRA